MNRDDALWREYLKTGDPDTREALIIRYVPLARYVVDRMNVPERGCVTREDLVSHAMLGLMDAVERYDPARDVKFETFAVPRIRGAVADMLRRMDWAPRSVRRLETTVRESYARLESRLGRPADDEEVSADLEMSLEQFHEALADIRQASVFSLEETVRASEDGGMTLASLLQDPNSPGPNDRAEASERTRILADAIGRLPEREQLIIALYYYEDLTLKEIGRVLDITEARVCQLHARVVLRLNGMLDRLRPVLCA